jgi:glycosyltransferase involved in cell wall biosynthesis
VLIPVYNECGTVESLIGKVLEAAPADKEIIVVDDCSTDGTRPLLEKLSKKYTFRLILNEKNSGKGACLIKALSFAAGDIVVPQDADLELDPADYVKLMEPILERGACVVFGSRLMHLHKGEYILRTLFVNMLFVRLINLLYGGRYTDIMTCYKMCKTEVLRSLDLCSERFGIEPEIACKVLKKGHKVEEVPISYYPRDWKHGKKIKWTDTFTILNIIIKYRFRD